MADFSIKGDTKFDHSGLSGGLTAMTAAAGNLIADMVQKIASGVQEAVQQIYDLGTGFETASAKLATIAGVDAVPGLSADIIDLSNATGAAAADLADVAYNAISAGVAVDNAVSTAGVASKLATAGFTDTGSALSVLTTAMNAYGESAGTATDISDSLITVQNLGVTTVAELSSSMGKAIASASAYGVDLHNLEAGYISLTKAGINTAEGTTYMSSMFKELGDSGSDVSKIIQAKTGKSFGQLMADGASLGDVLGLLNDSVDGDSEALMNLWGSAEAGKAASAILGQGLDTFQSSLDALGASAGSTESAYAIMADTMEYKTGVLKTNVSNLAISMYDSFAENLGPVVDFGLDCVQQLTDGFNENGIAGMIEAGENIVAGLIDTFIAQIPGIVNTGAEMLSNFIQSVADKLPELITTGTDMILRFIGSLTTSGNMSKLLGSAGQLVMKLLSGIIQNIPRLVQGALQLVTSLVTYLIQNFPKIVTAGGQLVGQLISGIIQSGFHLISAAQQLMSTFFQSWHKGDFKGLGGRLIDGIISGITGGLGKIANAAKNAAKSALNAAKSFLGIKSPSRRFRDEVGAQVPAGAAEGIDDNADLMVDAAVNSADDMIAAARREVLKHQLNVAGTYMVTGVNADAAASGRSAQADQSAVESMEQVIDLLKKIADDTDKPSPIYLDGDKWVGYTAPKMDKALGRIDVQKARG